MNLLMIIIKKKKKKNLSCDSTLDKEIEEFKSKLEMDLVSNIKIKPNFSEDWINGLRKRLRDRTTLKSI